MIPILYNADERLYDSWGIGPLLEISNPRVVEEGNGLFYFTFDYPASSEMYKHLKNQNKVVADASPELKNQVFVITRVTKPLRGMVSVYAEHISLYVTKNAGFSNKVNYNGNANDALKAWQRALITEEEVYVSSDITMKSTGTWALDKVQNARKVLGGVEGSILDVYGGEYRFNNLHISLMKSRGENRGVQINWGKNLIDLVDEEDLNRVYTAIEPFAKLYISEEDKKQMTDEEREEAEETILWLPEQILLSKYSNLYHYQRVALIDLTNENVTSIDDLRSKATAYMERNNYGRPKIDTKISHVDLSKTIEYQDIAEFEAIDLFDTVTVNVEKYDIIGLTAKVIEVDYNPVLERYNEIRIGNTLSTRFQDNVGSVKQIEASQAERLAKIEREIIITQERAGGGALIFKTEPGSSVTPIANNIGDTWYKKLGDGKTQIYVWNGVEWESILNLEELEHNIESAQLSAQEAFAKAEEALNKIEIKLVNDETGKVVGISMINDDGSESILFQIGDDGKIQITEDYFYIKQKLITNEMLAEGISADKITSGTLDAAMATIINLNASNMTTGRLTGAKFFLDLDTGEMNLGDLLIVDASGAATLSEQAKSELKGDTGEQGPRGLRGQQGPEGKQGIQGPKGADGKDAIVVSATAPTDTTRIWRKSLGDNELYIYVSGAWTRVDQEALTAISDKADISLLQAIREEMEKQNSDSSQMIGKNEVTIKEILERLSQLQNGDGTGTLDLIQQDMQGLIEREVVWNQDKIDEIVASIQNQYPELFKLTQRVSMDDTGTTFYATDSEGGVMSTATKIKNDGMYIETDGVEVARFTREGTRTRNLQVDGNAYFGNHMVFKSGDEYTIFSHVGNLGQM